VHAKLLLGVARLRSEQHRAADGHLLTDDTKDERHERFREVEALLGDIGDEADDADVAPDLSAGGEGEGTSAWLLTLAG